MPTGVYERTESHNTAPKDPIEYWEWIMKQSISRVGKHMSPNTEFKKGHKRTNGRLGKKWSETERMKRKAWLSNPDNIERLRNVGRKAKETEWKRIMELKKDFENQGFRFIPIGKVIPDGIAIKDGKIFAVELEYKTPNYGKYIPNITSFYDDVIWIIRTTKR